MSPDSPMSEHSSLTLWSKRLALAGIFVLLVAGLPVCILAPRALALFLPIAAGCCLPLVLLNARQLYQSRPTNVWIWLTGLLAFVLVGSLQAPDLFGGLHVVPGLLLNLLSFMLLAVASPLAVTSTQTLRWAGAGLALLLLLLAIEWLFGMPLNSAVAMLVDKPVPPLYALDRTIIIGSLLVWPLAAFGVFCGLRIRFLLPAILLFCWLVFSTSSQAAAVGLFAGILVYVFCHLIARLSVAIIRPAACIFLITAPALILYTQQLLPDNQNFWPAANSGERLGIWLDTTHEILKSPWLGHGFDALRRVEAGGMPRPHPHNGILQIWLETGLLGVLLTVSALYALLGAIRSLQPQLRPWVFATFATWMVVFCVGYNIWQIWWQAASLLVVYLYLQLWRLGPYSPICGRAEPNR